MRWQAQLDTSKMPDTLNCFELSSQCWRKGAVREKAIDASTPNQKTHMTSNRLGIVGSTFTGRAQQTTERR